MTTDTLLEIALLCMVRGTEREGKTCCGLTTITNPDLASAVPQAVANCLLVQPLPLEAPLAVRTTEKGRRAIDGVGLMWGAVYGYR